MVEENSASDTDSELDLFCYEDVSRNRSRKCGCVVLKEDSRWNLATYHLRRAIGVHSSRETLWVHSSIATSPRANAYKRLIVSSNLDWLRKWDLSRVLAIDMPTDSRDQTLWFAWRFKDH